MKCPCCMHENIAGDDECAHCRTSLIDVEPVSYEPGSQDAFARRPLGELATDDYIVVAPADPVSVVLGRLVEERRHCAMVLDGAAVVGILTERDVLQKLAGTPDAGGNEPVSTFMTADPETLEADDPVAFALNRMTVGGFRHIPILKDKRLIGVVSVRDILGYLVELAPGMLAAQP